MIIYLWTTLLLIVLSLIGQGSEIREIKNRTKQKQKQSKKAMTGRAKKLYSKAYIPVGADRQ